MDPLVTVIVSAAASITVALVGAFVARHKGLPGINAEIEQRMQQLVDTLQDQLDAMKVDFENCRAKLQESMVSERQMERRLERLQLRIEELEDERRSREAA